MPPDKLSDLFGESNPFQKLFAHSLMASSAQNLFLKKEGSKEFWQCYKCHIFLGPLANRIISAKIIKGTENRIFVFVLMFLLLYPVFVFAQDTCPPPVMAGRPCSSPTRCPA